MIDFSGARRVIPRYYPHGSTPVDGNWTGWAYINGRCRVWGLFYSEAEAERFAEVWRVPMPTPEPAPGVTIGA